MKKSHLKIEGLKGLDNLSKGLQNIESYLQSMSEFDSSKNDVLIPGNMLHQGTESMSEEESARFEQENPEVINLFQTLRQQIKKMLSGK